MHIGLLAPSWPPGNSANGIVTYVQTLSDSLREIGARVTVVSARNVHDSYLREAADLGTFDSIKHRAKLSLLRRLQRIRGDLPAYRYQLIEYLRLLHSRDPFDVFELEESFGIPAHLQSAIGARVVLRIHGPHFVAVENAPERLLDRLSRHRLHAEAIAFAGATAISCPSRQILQEIQKRFEPRTKLQRHIRNPVRVSSDETCWHPDAANSKEILFVGRFDTAKGADVCLDAFSIAAGVDPELRLVFVGPDNGIEVNSNRLSFWEYCRSRYSNSVLSRLDFKGLQPSFEVELARRRAFLTVVTSRYEVFPYAIAEAMALGCPVLATRSSGAEELVVDGATGWLAPVGDAQAIAEKMLGVLANRRNAANVGKAARQFCLLSLSPQAIAAETLEFYAHVCKK